MGKKGLLLVFISDYKADNQPASYRVKEDDGTDYWIEGTQTNDAPVKYLISKALKDNNKIEKIICIVSKKVRETGLEQFKTMVNDYIGNSEDLKAAYGERKMRFHKIKYPESEEKISDRAAEVYKKIASADCIGGEDEAGIYIDYTGGLRDMNFLMTGIIRYLEYHGVTCEDIVYSSYNRDDGSKNRIYSLKCIYSMYQLLNGVEQFVDTGNAELLQSCYDNEEDSDTKELLEQIVRFSHAMSLCDVRDVDMIMGKLCTSLEQFDSKEDKGSFFSAMFGDLTSIIRRKLYIEKGGAYSYPRLIQWCLDNNMVQQALTLYIEKMPEFYCNEGILKFSEEQREENSSKNPGQSWRTGLFYGWFYNQFVTNEKNAKKRTTYEKKVNALSQVKTYEGKIPGAATDDKDFLYNIMKYYLALKILRNRINHASELEAQESERRVTEQLEKEHGICMKIEFENIKSLIQEGINLSTPH